MENLDQKITEIRERNSRVEADKAWEVSWTRRLLITGLTYAIAVLFLWLIGNDRFWLNAAVPALGYLLSTLSLPWVKRWWIRQHQKSCQ